MNTKLVIAAALCAGLWASAQAQSQPESWKIQEGVGLVSAEGKVLYVGQSRKKVAKLSANCAGSVSACTFMLEPSAQTITVSFDGNKVNRIRFESVKDEFFFPPFGFHWGSTRGATPPMSWPEVDTIYPEGVAECSVAVGGCLIDMPKLGYSYLTNGFCDDQPVLGCINYFTQTVYRKTKPAQAL
ncbi:MAG: hypothetical protein U5L74_07265 [Ideonella sp.]|nr:hypothetical protein [Ideonella sp.]